MQACPSGPVVPLTQIHIFILLLAVTELEFLGHIWHKLLLFAPRLFEYFPAAQSTHMLMEVLPLPDEYFPDTQFIHEAFPMVFLYFPGIHLSHGPPSGPDIPKIHMHFFIRLLVAGEIESVGH